MCVSKSYEKRRKYFKRHGKIVIQKVIQHQGRRYDLRSIICHVGINLSKGHYTCFLKVGGNWWRFCDLKEDGKPHATPVSDVDAMIARVQKDKHETSYGLVYVQES